MIIDGIRYTSGEEPKLYICYISSSGKRTEANIYDSFTRLAGKVTKAKRSKLVRSLPVKINDFDDKDLSEWFAEIGLI